MSGAFALDQNCITSSNPWKWFWVRYLCLIIPLNFDQRAPKLQCNVRERIPSSSPPLRHPRPPPAHGPRQRPTWQHEAASYLLLADVVRHADLWPSRPSLFTLTTLALLPSPFFIACKLVTGHYLPILLLSQSDKHGNGPLVFRWKEHWRKQKKKRQPVQVKVIC